MHRPSERGLLRDALSRALARDRPFTVHHRASADLLVPADPAHPLFAPVKALVRSMSGQVPGTALRWMEAVAVRLEFFDEQLWLLVEPRVFFERSEDRAVHQTATSWAREHTARRYNAQWNGLVDAWAHLLAGTAELRAFGIGDGVDAAFVLSPTTAFSRRLRA